MNGRGVCRVVHVHEEGPAQQAGLQPGDCLVSIDDTPTRDLCGGDLAKLIMGPQDSVVALGIQRSCKRSATLSACREKGAWNGQDADSDEEEGRDDEEGRAGGDGHDQDVLTLLLVRRPFVTGGLASATVGVSQTQDGVKGSKRVCVMQETESKATVLRLASGTHAFSPDDEEASIAGGADAQVLGFRV